MIRYLSCLALILPSLGNCLTKDWTEGETYPLWSESSRWAPAGVPGVSDDVRIGFSPLTTKYLSIVYGSPDIQSMSIQSGVSVASEADIHIDSSLHIESNLLVDGSISKLHMYFGSDITLGAPSSPGEASITLSGNSVLYLSEWMHPSNISEVHSPGRIDVSADSRLSGFGNLHLGAGINLNGTLKTGANQSILNLIDTSVSPNPSLLDYDGDSETGTLDLFSPNTQINLPAPFADPFSGNIDLEQGAQLNFIGTGMTVIDGDIDMVASGESFPEDVTPAIIAADVLLFAESANYQPISSPRWLQINTNQLQIDGHFNLTHSNLTVNSPNPWLVEGVLSSSGGIARLYGSELVVGSATGPALIDAVEAFDFYLPVTLENSATITAGIGVSSSALTFRDTLTLEGPEFNSEFGSWSPMNTINPSTVSIYGDLLVSADTTIYASLARLGEVGALTPNQLQVAANQEFVLDARRLMTEPTTSLTLNNNASMDIVIRDPAHSPWVNNMDISMTNANLNTGEFCNRGNISGTGSITGTFVASHNGMACGGSVSPGVSIGSLKIIGNAQFNDTTFVMEIKGSSVKHYDRIVGTRLLSVVNGNLQVVFKKGYTPKVGDTFQLFSARMMRGLKFNRVSVSGLPKGLVLKPTKTPGNYRIERASQSASVRSL